MTFYCGLTLSSGIMDWTYLNQHFLRILPNKLQLFWPICFLRRRFLKIFLYKNLIHLPLWLHPTPEDNDWNKYQSKLPEEASTQFTAFMADWFLRRIFFIDFSLFILPWRNSTYPPNYGPTLPCLRGSWFVQT